MSNKKLTDCRRIARKHYKRWEELKNKSENSYKKLALIIPTEELDEILNNVCCVPDIDNISYTDIIAKQKKILFKEFNKYFKSKKQFYDFLKGKLKIWSVILIDVSFCFKKRLIIIIQQE